MDAALLKGNMVTSVRVTRTDARGPKVALPGIYPADILYLQRCVCEDLSYSIVHNDKILETR